ncbi:phosphoribosylamine--glycine ligase [Alkalicoccus daliensis]|uniref:Phosphoribosylamine--glycine ligase n=1 Tax=Alkalicoccus daliensis TaxID=745820 RepID=A0A1H0KKI1_9BACI|nr:phosphoribosylamine--glycine ligase [Alkalicoccus daliensis]SDO56251.1 phosphoribosylamine--glycine ligase [Alkalicoccus daliensis]
MNILLVGGGGREHALAWKLADSDMVDEIIVAPGNDAIAQILECRVEDVAMDDHEGLVQLAKEEEVELAIIGPEAPLVAGLSDKLNEAGIRVFGPSKAAAQLEGSKQFAKDIMKKYQIPTAAFESFTDKEKAIAYVKQQGAPIVIKADGLAAGKGVTVAETEAEALEAVEQMMEEKAFGEAGSSVVIEECLVGEELSFMAFVHGTTVVPMVTAQDHKRAFDGDKGPNTGGMGAYSPVPHLDGEWEKKAEEEILRPMAEAMVKEGNPFTGILYAGLMITEEGPKVIEFNTRFGDPEAQVILPRLKSDLVGVLLDVLDGKEVTLDWSENACAGVVLASEGYPGSYEKGVPFTLPMTRSEETQQFFHAGSKVNSEQVGWKTNGGRVFLLSTQAPTLEEAFDMTYQVLNQKSWDGLFYRSDIGHRVLKKTEHK